MISGMKSVSATATAFPEARSIRRSARGCGLIAIFFALVAAGPIDAAPPQTREQAVRSLAQPDASARRDAASRLGEVGTMADVRALVRALRDDDQETRANAELSLWRIWARS